MVQLDDDGTRPRLTARGAATRDRIVSVADDLMKEKGVAPTSLLDVTAASGTSKSQLYQHFANKEALVHEVINRRALRVLAHQRRRLARVHSMRGLELWRDELVQLNAVHDGAFGCPLGSMASELADADAAARSALAAHFVAWQELIEQALARLRDDGALRADADLRALAGGLLAAVQGGYLLAQTHRDTAPMRVAIDMALSTLGSYSTD